MKKVYIFLLLILPLAAVCQCPELINKPANNSKAFIMKVQELMGVTFSDSTILQDHFTYTTDGNLTTKIFAENNIVKAINIQGSKEQVDSVFNWIGKQYSGCNFEKGGQWLKFGEVVINWKDEGTKKRSLFISTK